MRLKQYILKYSLEFLVIVLGISLSFALEKRNAVEYQQGLKNQSLNRLKKNLEVDLVDLEYNYKAHTLASGSIEWISENNLRLLSYPKEKVGLQITNAISIGTLFVDNQEEYRALQNSGLIELIEIEEVVTALQNKYMYHEFYKKIEEEMMSQTRELRDYLYDNTELVQDKPNDLGFQTGRIFTGSQKIPQPLIERLKDKKWFHDYYRNLIKTRIKKDSILIEMIKKEIN